MPLDDPNDPPVQDEPQEPAPAPEPVEPQIDLDTAYDVITRHEGWDPRLTRYEIQEHKRRVQEFERERQAFERERARRVEPQDDGGDPYMRRISSLERIILEDREERKRREEESALVTRVAQDAKAAYTAMARQAGMTKDQMEAGADEFFNALEDMYPTPSLLREAGVERAARNAFRLIEKSGRPQRSPNGVNGRGPTATRTIPGSPQPFVPHGNPLPPEESLSAEQLPGETDDQYEARLRRIIEGTGMRKLPEGMKVQSR